MDNVAFPPWAALFSHFEYQIISQNERYTEIKSRFLEPGFGSAEATTVRMPALVLNQLVFEIKEPFRIDAGSTYEEVQSVFVLEGKATSQFYNLPGETVAEKNKHSFQYCPDFAGRHQIHPGKFQVLHLSFDLPFLQSLLQPAQDPLMDSICNRMQRKEAFPLAAEHLVLRPNMMEILQAIYNCRFAGMTRSLYIEAKILELFSLQLEQLSQPKGSAADRIGRTDEEKLHAVREFIEANYLLPLSLTQLSRDFFLNEFKLKKGYKTLFGTTVFGHIHHLRMAKARLLLNEGQMNVSEVSDFIGYSNVPAFTAAFRNHFGYPPSTYSKVV